jgi:transposase
MAGRDDVSSGRKEPDMSGRVPSQYPLDVRLEAVRLVREGGVTVREAAQTVGCTQQTMRNWVLRAERDDGVYRKPPSIDETSELAYLRRRVRVLEQEKEILRKAAAWFAKETHSTP